jgi:hypothetical protein
MVGRKDADQGRQSLLAPLLFAVLHFKVDVVEIANPVVISLFLSAQLRHLVDFLIVHHFEYILGGVGTQISDLDLVGFEALLGHAWSILDFL